MVFFVVAFPLDYFTFCRYYKDQVIMSMAEGNIILFQRNSSRQASYTHLYTVYTFTSCITDAELSKPSI